MGKLVKEWWEPAVFLWTNMNEPAFEVVLVAYIQLIFNIQKVQFYLVIIHLLLSFSFCDLLGQCLSNLLQKDFTSPLSGLMCLMKRRSTRNRKSSVSKHRNETISCKMKTCRHPTIQEVLAVWITVCLLIRKTVKWLLLLQQCSNSKTCGTVENQFAKWVHPVLERKTFGRFSSEKLYIQEGISDGSWHFR